VSPCDPDVSPWPREPSPCGSRSVALRGSKRRLAASPRPPGGLRARPDFGHLRHPVPEPIGRLPRHPHAARRSGDFAVPRQLLDEGERLGRGPAVFGGGARCVRCGREVRHPAG